MGGLGDFFRLSLGGIGGLVIGGLGGLGLGIGGLGGLGLGIRVQWYKVSTNQVLDDFAVITEY